MSNRRPLQIKKLILATIKDGKPHTFAELERRINTNWQTVRDHCRELDVFNCVRIEKRQSHKINNRPYYEITITKNGRLVLEKLESSDHLK